MPRRGELQNGVIELFDLPLGDRCSEPNDNRLSDCDRHNKFHPVPLTDDVTASRLIFRRLGNKERCFPFVSDHATLPCPSTTRQDNGAIKQIKFNPMQVKRASTFSCARVSSLPLFVATPNFSSAAA